MKCAGAELEEEAGKKRVWPIFLVVQKDGEGVETSASPPFPPCQCHRWRPRDWTIQFDRFIAFLEPLDEFRKYPPYLPPYLPR